MLATNRSAGFTLWDESYESIGQMKRWSKGILTDLQTQGRSSGDPKIKRGT